MKSTRFLWPLLLGFVMCGDTWASTIHVSLCSLQENPERYLNTMVQVQAMIIAGIENPHLTEGKCWFRFVRGDDYQDLGDRFPATQNEQWMLLLKLLRVSECASNIRVARAKIKGTIIRVPATGTIPPNEMPLELVIQSVSEVERVPVNCTPPASLPNSSAMPSFSQNTLVHESSHVDQPKQQ